MRSGPSSSSVSLSAPDAQHPNATDWRVSYVCQAPHRLGFFLGMLLLLWASVWWMLVHLGRVGWWHLPQAVSATVVHGAVMVFGVMPLFFSGFLFTAGPKWLGVEPPSVAQLRTPLLWQTAGWLLWVVAGHHAPEWALLALAMAALGWCVTQYQFARLLWRSRVPDRLHAQLIAAVGLWGLLCVGVLGVALSREWSDVALLAVRCGLWGCVGATFVIVIHRMLPFFTSSALPMMGIWRPFWVLWFLLGIMALEVVAAWQPFWQSTLGTEGLTWGFTMWALGLLELAAGSVVLWLAVAWGLVQSLKVRLLAMLHLGFLWLGLSLLLDGVSQLLGLRVGVPVFGLGALHAMTMGFIGSLLLAMVTRVTCGHGGRPLVADAVTWALFWALQITVVWRLLAGLPNASATGMAGAAVLWVLVIGAWCLRLMNWLGRPRADGRPG